MTAAQHKTQLCHWTVEDVLGGRLQLVFQSPRQVHLASGLIPFCSPVGRLMKERVPWLRSFDPRPKKLASNSFHNRNKSATN